MILFPIQVPNLFLGIDKIILWKFHFQAARVHVSLMSLYWKPRSTHGSASCFPSYRAPFLSSALSRTHPLLQAAGLPPPAQSVCPCLWASIIKPHKDLFPSKCISLLRLLIFFPTWVRLLCPVSILVYSFATFIKFCACGNVGFPN